MLLILAGRSHYICKLKIFTGQEVQTVFHSFLQLQKERITIQFINSTDRVFNHRDEQIYQLLHILVPLS